MTSGLAPDSLSDKHHLIAYMALAGATNVEIASALDYHPNRVSIIRTSPLFKSLMDKMRSELQARTVGGVIDRIIAEGPRSVNVLVELRDHADGEQTRLHAARDLLDRNPETSKVSRTQAQNEHRFVLDSAALHKLAGVLAEDSGMVITGLATPADAPPPPILTLDEALAAMQAAEAQDPL